MKVTCTIEQARKIMRSNIASAIKSGAIPPNMATIGPIGVGKSSITNNLKYDVAKDLDISPSKVIIIDVRLGAMEESEVLGVPIVDHENNFKYATPPWFEQACSDDPNDDCVYIIFMDELPAASRAVQRAAYRVILDRTIQNGKKLSNRAVIIAAGNRPEDNTGVKPLDPALANRFSIIMHIDKIEQGFINYVINNDWNHTLVSFLANDAYVDMIYKPGNIADPSFPTPRSWEEVNKILNKYSTFGIELDEEILRIELAGCVGSEASDKFLAYREFNSYLPDWDDIIKNGVGDYKVKTEEQLGIYAIASNLGLVILTQIDKLKNDPVNLDKVVGNLVELANLLPMAQRVVIGQVLGRRRDLLGYVMQSPSANAFYQSCNQEIKKVRA